MNSLEKHVIGIRDYKYDESQKNKLIDMMIIVWKGMLAIGQPVTISSSTGGKHKSNSKHYVCEAFDFNPDKGYSTEYVIALQSVLKRLPYRYRCLIEFNTTKSVVYRCTHLEFNNVKTGIYTLDYQSNVSSALKVI